MQVLDTVNLTLDLQDFEIPVTFCVVPCLQLNIILGIQVLSQTKANIDMDCQTLTFHNYLAGTAISNKSDTLVQTTEAILLPPRSECLVLVMVPPDFGIGLAIIEPSNKLHKLQLALAKSVVSPTNNRTVFKIMNPTGVARFLRRKTPWGFISDVRIDNVTVITDSILKSDSHTHQVDSGQNIEVSQEEKLQQLTEKGISLQQN